MSDPQKPTSHVIDVVSQHNIPLRFVFEGGDTVRYFDRRYPTLPNEPHYRPGHYDENGQTCGPALPMESFTEGGNHGIVGWHEVDAWTIDFLTRELVAAWLVSLTERWS